ncbi:Amino acid permease OS=Streptomyces antimycoticus OX=68175 GN=SSPO_077890 PE=4 SV=1 [Streptomyces antimycoticus]
MGVATAINVFGMKLADRVNKVLMFIALGSLVLFATLCVSLPRQARLIRSRHGDVEFGTSISAVTGTLIAAFSAAATVSTLGEEVRGGARTIGRGIIGCVIAAGAISSCCPS